MRSTFVFIAVIFLFFLGILLIFRAASHPKPKKPVAVITPLPDYSTTDATAVLNIDGALTGDDTHRAIRITIGRDQRLLEIIQGYSGNVTNKYASYNSPDAYRSFLRAINFQGYTLSKKGDSDPAGYCPDGNRYIFKFNEQSKDIYNSWSTNCDNKTGTFAGNSAEVISLFQRQITNYNQLTADVNL